MSLPMRVQHANGTATADPAKVSCNGIGCRLAITNLEAAGGNMLEISFDSGHTFFSVPPQATFSEPVKFHFFYVKGAGDYTALMFVG